MNTILPPRYTVHGRVIRFDNTSLAGAIIHAVDWSRGGENLLGSARGRKGDDADSVHSLIE